MSGGLLVAHLVRRQEGLEAFQRFVASYLRHRAGRDHELAVLAKGFTEESAWAPYAELLAAIPHRRHAVPDEGFDLGAYRAFLPAASGRPVLFLNSHSEIVVDGWLDLLARHSGPGRLVGASGSWNSTRKDRLTDVPPWVTLRRRLRSRFRRGCLAFIDAWRDVGGVVPFPNPHVRTNAFLVPPDLHHLVAAWPVPGSKEACYELESGSSSLSSLVLAQGGSLLVAGSDGRAYGPLEWPGAGVFCSDRQQHLIIADNHTRAYAGADRERRRLVGWYTWRSFHVMP